MRRRDAGACLIPAPPLLRSRPLHLSGVMAGSTGMLTRRAAIDGVVRHIQPIDCVRALWLGGSDATARSDGSSDVDLVALCAPGGTDECIRHVRDAVAAIAPIVVDYRLPSPTWHGFEQGFYQLDGVPEELMIDWMVIEAGRPHPWFEVERHGEPLVLFDKDGLIRPAHVDRDALRAAAARRVAEARLKFRMFRHLPGKFARRGLPVDAAHFYHALVLRTLVDVLRCVHCMDRHDFSLRYLRDDLPEAVYRRLAPLLYPAEASSLDACVRQANDLFEEAIAAWDARTPVA